MNTGGRGGRASQSQPFYGVSSSGGITGHSLLDPPAAEYDIGAMTIPKAIGIWLILVAVAILNGTIRQFLLAPNLSQRTTHQISSILLSILILFVVLALIPVLGTMSKGKLLGVGLLWLVLTVAFEFTLGRFAGRSWEYLLADYNLFQGRLWILVLATTCMAPLAATRLRGARR